jgi:predicted metal-dependent enzyme (double-stranded beta helix superfamily)
VSVPAYASLDDLVPHEGLLDATELEAVAVEIADRPEIWGPLVRADPGRRRYELIYEDERMDAWVLSWMPGQGTGFHDHFTSSVGICVVTGAVREAQLRLGADHVEARLAPGGSLNGGPGYIHRIQHADGEPAVTIHVYSPLLDWVGQYRVDGDGILRREPAPGRTELTP